MTDQLIDVSHPEETGRGAPKSGRDGRAPGKRPVGRPRKHQPSPDDPSAGAAAAKAGKQRPGPKVPPASFLLSAADASTRRTIEQLGDEALAQARNFEDDDPSPGKRIRQAKRGQPGGRGRLTEVQALGDDLEKIVRSMLENGNSFEETAKYINQRHQPATGPRGITLEAVKRYFRDSKQLQARRVKRMQELAREIKQELVGKPDAAEADVIDAIIFTGLMGLDRDSMPAGASEAAKHYVACQALRLKQRMQSEKIRTERLQRRVMRQKLEDLTRALKQESGGRALGPETLERIREIYGLFAKPGSAVVGVG